MKNAIIFHAHGESPESYWIPWLKKNLEGRGYAVGAPKLPDANHPTIAVQLPFVIQNAPLTSDTVLVGHSAGVALIQPYREFPLLLKLIN